MAIIESLTQIIGNTPLIHFDPQKFDIPSSVRLYGKMEFLNPGGSIKDRTVYYMFRALEKAGKLSKGGHVVDVDAGNTGVAMAWIGAQNGYKITIILPDAYVIEKQIMMRALGAEVLNYPKGDRDEAKRLLSQVLKENPKAIFLNQYEDLSNQKGHETHTAEEIQRDLGKVDYFIAGAGTGGAFSGIVRHLKQKNPQMKAILINPKGSIYSGGEKKPFHVSGIGNHFIPGNLDFSLIDEIVDYEDTKAHEMVLLLAQKMGLLVGSASGLNVHGALSFARGYEGKAPINIVTLLTDDAWRYFSENIYGAATYVDIKSKLLKG